MEPEPELEPEPEPEQPQVAEPPKTSVTITATGAWVQIKIGNYKPYTINKLSGPKQIVTKIRPGEHKISKRLDAKGEWKSLGKVKIPEARTATVSVNGDIVTVK